ncbi:MAG: Rne/Rng family ribonuclease [Firmicutes bacterium]|nr:Rne/Rng family ribonuclease [Bacillota bacterium]
MSKEILINVETEETRVAFLEEGVLVEIYVERAANARIVGNIYKGLVQNVLPGMQAAFVDIGMEKNAFLYVDDALPQKDEEDEVPDLPRRNIKDLLRLGQEIMVQVVKDAFGTKGPRVTTHITLPGRYTVLMPTTDFIGISRRIGDEKERDRLRRVAEKIRPAGNGLIVRTVAEGKTEQELSQDVAFLYRLWGRVKSRARVGSAPALIHRDLGLVYRVIRDSFTNEVNNLYVDSRHEYERIMDLLDVISPELKDRVQFFQSRDRGVFDLYGVEPEIEQALKNKIWLKSGGYIVVDQTEALTVIDVNTGKFVGTTNLADTVFKTNLEAAREIARQLRLRDIGGIIIADFIDMEVPAHRREVLRTLEEALKGDKNRATVLGLTQLGLVEMTRKKVRQGLAAVLQKPCPYCQGTGRVLTEETISARVRRQIKDILRHSREEAVLIEVHPLVAAQLIGSSGTNLRELERETGKAIFIKGSTQVHVESMNLKAIGPRADVEAQALPVRQGEVLELKIEEGHAINPWNGIARLEGYVIDVDGGGRFVGEKVKVEITRVFKTYARARLVEAASRETGEKEAAGDSNITSLDVESEETPEGKRGEGR